MIKFCFAIFLIYITSNSVFAQPRDAQVKEFPSHCQPGEYAFLNAYLPYEKHFKKNILKNKEFLIRPESKNTNLKAKFISICTNRKFEPYKRVIYRFGALGNVEYEKVAKQSSPMNVFIQQHSQALSRGTIFFTDQARTYCISIAGGQGSGISLDIYENKQLISKYFSGNDRGIEYEAGKSYVEGKESDLLEIPSDENGSFPKSPAFHVVNKKHSRQSVCWEP